jgi:hydroxymethylglutaryl-CoA lyase
MLDGLGMTTGINLDLLADAGDFISGALGRPTGSRVGKALHGVRRAARAA